jgi:hypothetical protein
MIKAVQAVVLAGRGSASGWLVGDAWHAAPHLGGDVIALIRHHAAAVGRFLVSSAAFAGCDAVLGLVTGPVGAIAGAGACTGKGQAAADLGQFGKGLVSVPVSLIQGGISQLAGNWNMIGSCATGSWRDCWNVWNQLGPSGPIWALIGAAKGFASTAQSLYDQFTGGRAAYAAGRLTGYLALAALTRGDLAPADSSLLSADGYANLLSRFPKAARDSLKPPGFDPATWQWPGGITKHP